MITILIPTDFSKNAWNAIRYAMDFFKSEDCTFYFLNTYTPPFYRIDYGLGGLAYSTIPDMGVDVSLAGLEQTVMVLKKEFRNSRHRFETLSAFNTLTGEITAICQRMKVDLIVMGTQGATGAKEIFLGSNTVHVIRKAEVAVMAIPVHYTYREIRSVLFPTDYLTHYKKNELRIMVDIVKKHEAKLTVLHVKEEYDMTAVQQENRKFLAAQCKHLQTNFEEMKGNLMPDAIHSYILEHDPDLLALMNRKHSFFERLLMKQHIDSIGFHAQIPFLIMPETVELSK